MQEYRLNKLGMEMSHSEILLDKYEEMYKSSSKYWNEIFGKVDSSATTQFFLQFGNKFSFRKFNYNNIVYTRNAMKEIFEDINLLKQSKKNKIKWKSILKKVDGIVDWKFKDVEKHLDLLRTNIDSDVLVAFWKSGMPELILQKYINKLDKNPNIWRLFIDKLSEDFIDRNIDRIVCYETLFFVKRFSYNFIEKYFNQIIDSDKSLDKRITRFLLFNQPIGLQSVKNRLGDLVNLRFNNGYGRSDASIIDAIVSNDNIEDKKDIIQLINQYRDLI